jgi:hypothetical protein
MVAKSMVAALFLVATLGASAVGRADEQELQEIVTTVTVSSSDHEAQEGYFSLGDNATVVVKPGTELYQYLSRRRGQTITIRVTEAAPQLSRLTR